MQYPRTCFLMRYSGCRTYIHCWFGSCCPACVPVLLHPSSVSATTPFLCNSCFLRNIPKFIWMNGSSMLGITVPLTNCHWPLVCTLRVPDVIYDPWLWRRKINNRRKGSLGNFFEYVVFFMPILEKCCASSLALIVSCSNVLHSLDLCKVMLELLQEVRL